jgi:hypothetical protein
MSANDAIIIAISATEQGVSRPGFATALVAGYHTKWADRVREYSGLAGLVADGFAVTDAIYLAAAAYFGQNPRPKKFKVGRCVGSPTQIIHLTPSETTAGYVYTFEINGEEIVYTVLGGDTVALICDALVIAINASVPGLAGTLTATDGTTHVICTGDPGYLFNYGALPSTIALADVTTDPATGIATDLAAIRLADADWYGLTLACNCEAMIEAAAAWAETERVIFGYNSADTLAKAAGTTTDVFSDLQDDSLARSFGLFNGETLGFAAMAWCGKMFVDKPGASTWAFKTLATVAADVLTTSEDAALEDKNANTYSSLWGRNVTWEGRAADGSFIDVTVFIDWLTAEMTARMIDAFANAKKIPYTDKGIAIIKAEVLAALKLGAKAGGIDPDSPMGVDAPLVADIDPTDRAARRLPDVTFFARGAGAIHGVDISGVITF